MTKWVIPDTPSPEAIVRAALERAAARIIRQANTYGNDFEVCRIILRGLADDPAEVAAIIKKAEEDRG